jgi:hypothetical protein
MNPPPDISDPFLKSLADEASELPGLAANEARRFSARRAQHRRRLTWGLVIAVTGVCYWQTRPLLWPIQNETGPPPILAHQPPDPKATRPAEFVKLQTMQEAMSQPLPTPPGARQEQKDLLEAARGLPLVLVMDDSGKLARIHVVERIAPP